MGCEPSSNKKKGFVWDASSKYADHFMIEGKKATFKGEDKYQITGEKPLAPNSTITIRLLKYGGDSFGIGIGVITADRKNMKFSGDLDDKKSIGYWTDSELKQGWINVEGETKIEWEASLFIEEKGLLVIEIDEFGKKITFINKRTEETHVFELDSKYHKKSAYLFVTMSTPGDSVEILE